MSNGCWIDSTFFELHFYGESYRYPQTQEFANVYNSFQWMRCAWRNWELACYGLRQIKLSDDLEKWPNDAFILFGSIHFYFGMLNCVAQCIHQRYIDEPKRLSIQFSDPTDWNKSIPGHIKYLCSQLRQTDGWLKFKDKYRNAITHRQLPIFWNACLDDVEFIRLFDWAKLNDDGYVVYDDNPQLIFVHEEDYSMPDCDIKWLDDVIERRMMEALAFIKNLCREMYDLNYLVISETKDKV